MPLSGKHSSFQSMPASVGPLELLHHCGFLSYSGGCIIACLLGTQTAVSKESHALITVAGEGDLRLVDGGEISNWAFGNLQLFFEGSWSQVCKTSFGPRDADVACRQLGYGAGTVVPQSLTIAELDALERTTLFPEVGIIGLGCTGDELRLVDCNTTFDRDVSDYLLDYFATSECMSSDGAGLVLACVAEPLPDEDAGASANACPSATFYYSHLYHIPA